MSIISKIGNETFVKVKSNFIIEKQGLKIRSKFNNSDNTIQKCAVRLGNGDILKIQTSENSLRFDRFDNGHLQNNYFYENSDPDKVSKEFADSLRAYFNKFGAPKSK